jgi:DNA-binding response OmpR family regulator
MAHRILLVDDEVALRTFVARALRFEEYDVVEAADGLHAWKLVKESSFDLVVTDSRMPHLNGYQLTALVRELHPTMPILRLSGSHNTGSNEIGIRTLFKPFEIPDLVKAVRSLLAG